MTKNDSLLTLAEFADATGLLPWEATRGCALGLILPAEDTIGRRHSRRFDAGENVLDGTEYGELGRAGLTTRHIQRIFAVHRAELVGLPPAARLVRRFEQYINTIVTLATVFGKGDGFDEWYARRQAQLARMRRDLAQPARRRRAQRPDRRLLKFFTEAKVAQTAQAIAG